VDRNWGVFPSDPDLPNGLSLLDLDSRSPEEGDVDLKLWVFPSDPSDRSNGVRLLDSNDDDDEIASI
jgi:hypothetical protein